MEGQFAEKIQLVVFDLAGTTVDFGCMAPVAAFVEGFKAFGVEISPAQARGPMGMEKRAHIEALASLEDVADQWRKVHGREINGQDIDAMYEAFVPNLLAVLPDCSATVPGLEGCIDTLDTLQIPYAATTGYFREAADIVLSSAAQQGFQPHVSCCATEVSAGRPAPWMIYRCMEQLGAYPPTAVINVGDTVVDVASARNAGVWSIGVTASGNAVGLSERELEQRGESERQELLKKAEQQLLDAGAHYVIESVAQLPIVLDAVSEGQIAEDV